MFIRRRVCERASYRSFANYPTCYSPAQTGQVPSRPGMAANSDRSTNKCKSLSLCSSFAILSDRSSLLPSCPPSLPTHPPSAVPPHPAYPILPVSLCARVSLHHAAGHPPCYRCRPEAAAAATAGTGARRVFARAGTAAVAAAAGCGGGGSCRCSAAPRGAIPPVRLRNDHPPARTRTPTPTQTQAPTPHAAECVCLGVLIRGGGASEG